MYLLLACSLAVITVVLERGWFWWDQSRTKCMDTRAAVLEQIKQKQWQDAVAGMEGRTDYILNVLRSGIEHRTAAPVKAMEKTAAEEIQKMKKYLNLLDTMITVAPMLGIFGTVIGIIASFKVLGSAGISQPQEVVSGISQALITTAAGLFISIMAVFPFQYFNSRVENAVHEIEQFATELEIVSGS